MGKSRSRKVLNPEQRFHVLIEQTGVETVVSKSYYEKYAKDGIRFLGIVGEDQVKAPSPEPKVGHRVKSLDEMSWDELKDAATLKGLTFPGNASKETLKELISEA